MFNHNSLGFQDADNQTKDTALALVNDGTIPSFNFEARPI